jgi:hypothetical protein
LLLRARTRTRRSHRVFRRPELAGQLDREARSGSTARADRNSRPSRFRLENETYDANAAPTPRDAESLLGPCSGHAPLDQPGCAVIASTGVGRMKGWNDFGP